MLTISLIMFSVFCFFMYIIGRFIFFSFGAIMLVIFMFMLFDALFIPGVGTLILIVLMYKAFERKQTIIHVHEHRV